MKILIVEDEAAIREYVLAQLAVAGFDCDCADSVAEASMALVRQSYDLMLLDRWLPDGDGVTAIGKFRALQAGLRILVVTASDTLQSKVSGLDAGADDYLTKPFAPEELLARVRARLREFRGASLPRIKVGALSYDPATTEISIDGRPLILHRREFALLEALVRHVNLVAPRKSVMLEVYGEDDAVSPGALDTLVSRLRRRLEEAQAGVSIHLVRGRGYLLTEAAC